MTIKEGTLKDFPSYIQQNHLVLDVGGGAKPVSRANYVIDFLPWNRSASHESYFKSLWPTSFFSKETWVTWDLCSRQPWPFEDKQFDFVVCKHTLEDLRDPIWVCQEMMRVAKSGYVETPSRIVESMPGIERSRYCGYSHHHWLCDVTDRGIEFMFKPAQIHGYRRFHVSAGPEWNSDKQDHSWTEGFDFLESLFSVVNRCFREVNPKYLMTGFYWFDSFDCRERVLLDKGAVERDLIAFKERCKHLSDLWLWKRTWYGKRLHHADLQASQCQ